MNGPLPQATGAATELLGRWAGSAEEHWYVPPGRPDLGCYGTGFNDWGVQTNQKYLGAMAALGTLGGEAVPEALRERCIERARTALRYSLRTHVSGDTRRTDASRWGHTWISPLGVERMMYGVDLLRPHLDAADRDALRRVLASEADWQCYEHTRGAAQGVVGDPWASSGRNVPESNLWNGAVLWRTAALYPDHEHAEPWRERAHRFLMNSVSVPADAVDEGLVAGRRVSDWHVGANFFPHYALDHHGYLNVGYMVICLSNAAMLHFDMKALGLEAPESLYHHQRDLWGVVRRLVFGDGRLARIGGDTRVRYAYCQEYLMPTLLFAADALGDEHATGLLARQIEAVRAEAEHAGDGSFYGRRLAWLAQESPYYYTRLESDRACALGMVLRYSALIGSRPAPTQRTPAVDFEASVAGRWCEPEHGAVAHRSPRRLASFAWRAQGLAQGMCQPPDDGHLAEWTQNLGGLVQFCGRGGSRRLEACTVHEYEGGFATCGAVVEGVGVVMPEGWKGEESALHRIAFVALPDECTVVGMQHCRTVERRTFLRECKGLHLNLPNDLHNDFRRRIETARGSIALQSPPQEDGVVPLGGRWACIDGRLGVAGLWGAEELVVDRSRTRRGGPYRSLYVDEVCWHCALGTRSVDAGTVILDVGWAVLSDADAARTERFERTAVRLPGPLHAVRVPGRDGRDYVVAANFGEVECPVAAEGMDLPALTPAAPVVPPGEVCVFVVSQRA